MTKPKIPKIIPAGELNSPFRSGAVLYRKVKGRYEIAPAEIDRNRLEQVEEQCQALFRDVNNLFNLVTTLNGEVRLLKKKPLKKAAKHR